MLHNRMEAMGFVDGVWRDARGINGGASVDHSELNKRSAFCDTRQSSDVRNGGSYQSKDTVEGRLCRR